MTLKQSKSFKRLRNLPYKHMFSIYDIKQPFYVFLLKHSFLAWIFRQFIKILRFQLLVFSDLLEYNHYWGHVSEHIIIGENPIITLALLKQISEKAYKEKIKIKVLIIKFSDHDYWGYHYFEQNHNWSEIGKSLNTKIENMNDFIEFCLPYKDNKFIDIDYLNSSSKIFHNKFDKLTQQWVFILGPEIKSVEPFAKKMPTVLRSEGLIKEKYWEKILNHLNQLKIKTCTLSQDLKEKKLILFSKQVFLTSYPKGWLQTKKDSENIFSTFKHSFSHNSFGTSERMANSFDVLDIQAIEDINTALNFKIKSVN